MLCPETLDSSTNIIKSKYPIVAVAMNKVSDINLAVAVYHAGATPSISLVSSGYLDAEYLKNLLIEFKYRTGSTQVILSFSWEDILKPQIVELLSNHNFKHIEIFHRPLTDNLWPAMQSHLLFLKNHGFMVIAKTLKAITKVNYDNVILKGPEGAGRTLQDVGTLEENFNIYKREAPTTGVIPSGGIYSNAQVRQYLSSGAIAVGIGTLFAIAEESCVSLETKQEILKSTSELLEFRGKFNHRGIVFSHLTEDDDNNTRALLDGINSPSSGMLFAGNAIDYIKSIRPVKDIILNLIGEE